MEGQHQGFLFINTTGLRPGVEVTPTASTGAGGRPGGQDTVHCYLEFLMEELVDLDSGLVQLVPAVPPEQHGPHLPPASSGSVRRASLYPQIDGAADTLQVQEALQVVRHEASHQAVRDGYLDTDLPLPTLVLSGSLTPGPTEAPAPAPASVSTPGPLETPPVISVISAGHDLRLYLFGKMEKTVTGFLKIIPVNLIYKGPPIPTDFEANKFMLQNDLFNLFQYNRSEL